jgi:hypothetical protein
VKVQVPSTARLSDEEMAAVVIAITSLSRSTVMTPDDEEVTPAWRFSGRWFGPHPRRG